MSKLIGILKIYPESFRANLYTIEPFRMIGLIDADIMYSTGIERVTLAYFRSSGTNSGKIRGLWYPIVGIKTHSGSFVEFTRYINYVLSITTRHGRASKGWLAKSLFFAERDLDKSMLRGFSGGKLYSSLLWIGETLRDLYEDGKYQKVNYLDKRALNSIVISNERYPKNKFAQRENYEMFIREIFEGIDREE